jgi:tetratricopeptide (TPR) repeat protein
VVVQRLAILLIGLFTVCANAQRDFISSTKPREAAPKSTSRPISITYRSPTWNESSTKIDTAFVVMREKQTGKLVQIQLEETEPDSGQFSGKFSVSLTSGEKTAPEIYAPTDELRKKDTDNRKLHEAIKAKAITAKPVIWTSNEKGQAVLDVYDTQAEASTALKGWEEKEKARKLKLIKPVGNEASHEAAKQAEHKNEMDKLAVEAAARESQRQQLENLELKKASERERQMQQMSADERAKRKAQALKVSEEAMGFFNKGMFKEAEAKFRQAVELDPENKSYYFRYGITLYRLEKYNEALVTLKVAKPDPSYDAERLYHMGLVHYRLKELDSAVEALDTVGKMNHPLSPGATFYKGIALYSQEKYEAAKSAFETVIDTSSDPRMDEQAESYLDLIAQAMIFQKMKEQKFILTGTLGLSYDSNITLAPDSSSDQGTSTDVADARLLTIADAEYRPVFGQHHEFSAKATANLTNSSKDEAAIADPFIYDFAFPYTYKGTMGTKGVRTTIKPGYEIMYMDPTSTGTKEQILKSTIFDWELTLVMSPTWFSTYGLNFRIDDSLLSTSIGDDDADSNKSAIRTVQTSYIDPEKKQSVSGTAAYTINAAKGDNEKYTRIDGGVTYSRPVAWESAMSLGLSIYKVTYDAADERRSDFNTTLSVGASKPIRDWVTWGVSASYIKNDSNLTANEYSKYVVLTTGTFNTAF